MMPPHRTPVLRAEGGGVGSACIGAAGGNGLAWGEGGRWVAMLSSRPTASSPVPEAQLQQSKQQRGAGVPEPPVSFTYASLAPAAQQPGFV